MQVRFKKNTPYTRRPGSTKQFLAGQVYVLDNEYANELIEQKVAEKVKEVTIDELKRKR